MACVARRISSDGDFSTVGLFIPEKRETHSAVSRDRISVMKFHGDLMDWAGIIVIVISIAFAASLLWNMN